MPTFDADAASCFVFTFKEGLLSRVAHDLKLRVTRLTVDVGEAGASLEATFDPASLVVDCVVEDGRERPGVLSRADRDKIADTIRRDVLHADRHPEIRFRATSVERGGDDAVDVAGELSLHGVTRRIRATARRVGDAYETEVRLHQPDFGIKPYRAAMGALKVRADVLVKLRVPHPGRASAG